MSNVAYFLVGPNFTGLKSGNRDKTGFKSLLFQSPPTVNQDSGCFDLASDIASVNL